MFAWLNDFLLVSIKLFNKLKCGLNSFKVRFFFLYIDNIKNSIYVMRYKLFLKLPLIYYCFLTEGL